METEVDSVSADALAPCNFAPFFERHPVIDTPRLILRPLKRSDVEDIFAYGNDPAVTDYMIWPRHETIQDAYAYLDIAEKAFANKEQLIFAIESKEHHKLIGSCGFHHLAPEHQRVEIGYVLTRQFWGYGYMTETVNAMIDFAFNKLRVHRVEANCDESNVRSYKVMERCGLTYEGTAKDHEIRHDRRVTLRMYSICAANFSSQAPGKS